MTNKHRDVQITRDHGHIKLGVIIYTFNVNYTAVVESTTLIQYASYIVVSFSGLSIFICFRCSLVFIEAHLFNAEVIFIIEYLNFLNSDKHKDSSSSGKGNLSLF